MSYFPATVAGLALLDDASAAAQRTTLAVVPGTDVQAYDAGLLSLAALATGADKLPYTTGVDTYAEATFTAAGRALVDDANAAAQRTTLGVGTGDTPTFAQVSLGTPTTGGHAATKTYVDNNIQGIKTKVARLATVADLNGAYTYSNGVITGPAATALSNIDGVAPAVNDAVLVKNAAVLMHRGLYTIDALGGAGAYSMTRHISMDTGSEFNGALVFVTAGNTLDGSRWLYNGAASPTVGTTDITFSQLSDPATEYTAGNGLTLTGNDFNVGGTADRITVGADAVDIASTYVGQTSIVTLGTVTTGTWGGLFSAGIVPTAALAADAVTYATMQNVSATDKLLGRSTAGAGNVEEIACTSAARSILDDTTVGAIATTLGLGTGDSPTFTNLTLTGQFARPVIAKTGAYTATASDWLILCNSTTAAFSITLPAAAGITGRQYVIKKTDASANAVTIDGNAAETIDGSATKVLTIQHESLSIVSDGTNWVIV